MVFRKEILIPPPAAAPRGHQSLNSAMPEIAVSQSLMDKVLIEELAGTGVEVERNIQLLALDISEKPSCLEDVESNAIKVYLIHSVQTGSSYILAGNSQI
jgi:hypothetical protein